MKRLFKRSYPQFIYEDFQPIKSEGVCIGHVAKFHFTVRGKEYECPMVCTANELGNANIMRQLFVNGINSAHDIVDEMLKRGMFKYVR